MVAAAYSRPSIDLAARMARVRKLAWLLDAQFGVPGTKFRFGINSVIGLAPGIGDVLLGMVSLYIVNEARAMGVPPTLLGQMLVNVIVEMAGGSVPFLGDVFDMAFKANLRNLALLEGWYAQQPR